ncbi:Hypothetical predicted protein, partial [Paramuricea clavata]
KLRRRKAALDISSTWAEREKADIKIGLVRESMSPENSEDEPLAENDEADSDEEAPMPARKKSIVVSPLAWRSERFKEILVSLDRKWLRRCNERSRTMMKEKRVGPELNQPTPEGIPLWMRKRA